MMGLFSSPLARIQFLMICLGSWACFSVDGIAQDKTTLSNSASEFVAHVKQASADTSGTHLQLSDTGAVQFSTPIYRSYGSGGNGAFALASASTLTASHMAAVCPDCQPTTLQLQTLVADEASESTHFLRSEDALDGPEEQQSRDEAEEANRTGDDELGILRVRSQPVGLDSELGLLRVRPNNPNNEVPVEVEPEPTRRTSVFLTGRSNVYGGNNLFRTPNPIDDRIYQAGVGIFAFPRLSESTNLVLSAEANVARYEELSVVDYNELQFQAGIRQRLGKRSYGQLNWRFQNLSTPGRDSFFSANYIELLLSRRDILSNRVWLDTYYQARLSQSDPKEFSRLSHIATGSLNYGFDPQTRVSLLYQLFLDDYTQVVRFDTYHQILAQFSHDISSSTRLSLFTGVRFGDSTLSTINFDDTIYGVSFNVNVPLF